MKVFVFQSGEMHEGGYIRDIFDSRKKAKAALDKLIKSNDFPFADMEGYNVELDNDGMGFSIGCDWYAINEYEVK